MSDINVSADVDVKRARDSLVYFHNQALKYPDNYRLQFSELVDYYQSKTGGAFLSGLGLAINSTGISDGKVKDAFSELADRGEGKLPERWNDFMLAIQGKATEINFSDAANAVLVGTARDIGAGLEKVGETVIDTAKNAAGLVTWLPLMAFAALGFYLYVEVKKHEG